jgi:hypothetical protein
MKITIADTEYELYEVILTVTPSQDEAEQWLTFDLFADSSDTSRAGFAFNALTVQGRGLKDLNQTTFELDEFSDDPFNELRESVICELGQVLELSHLKLDFGAPVASSIEINLNARCFRVDEDTSERIEGDVPVTGSFVATIR